MIYIYNTYIDILYIYIYIYILYMYTYVSYIYIYISNKTFNGTNHPLIVDSYKLTFIY